MTKITLPANKAKYKCKPGSHRKDMIEVYCGREWIAQLWYSPYISSWGVSDTMSLHESDSSRVTSKEDMLYLIDCIEQLNAQPITNIHQI